MATMQASEPRVIPIVDLGKLGVGVEGPPDEEDLQRVAKELGDALKGVGFAYLANHGIHQHLIEDALLNATKFFNLEDEVKQKYKATLAEEEHGYIAMNREHLNPEDDFMEFRESYMMKQMTATLPDEELPEWRPILVDLHASAMVLVSRLLTAMALALGLERDYFTSCHKEVYTGGETTSCWRYNYYPSITKTIPANSIRCGAHTDYGTITLLFQDHMGGLQVVDTSGSWVDATPIPGTIIINAGDLLQFWTSGKFVATKHRVVVPEEECRRRVARQSVAFFIHPDDATEVTPLDGSHTYGTVNARQHTINKFNKTFRY